ncbi:MAG: hypothetical protein AAB388_01445 [Patescibacteria group bacterium]
MYIADRGRVEFEYVWVYRLAYFACIALCALAAGSQIWLLIEKFPRPDSADPTVIAYHFRMLYALGASILACFIAGLWIASLMVRVYGDEWW